SDRCSAGLLETGLSSGARSGLWARRFGCFFIILFMASVLLSLPFPCRETGGCAPQTRAAGKPGREPDEKSAAVGPSRWATTAWRVCQFIRLRFVHRVRFLH